ncbi:MAG: hypothetical protein AAGJ31_03250 [Verrucomicrobiota bacterium]
MTLLTKWPEFDLVDRLDELLTFFDQSALISKNMGSGFLTGNSLELVPL